MLLNYKFRPLGKENLIDLSVLGWFVLCVVAALGLMLYSTHADDIHPIIWILAAMLLGLIFMMFSAAIVLPLIHLRARRKQSGR